MSPFCCHVRMPCAVNIWRIAPQKTSRFDAWNASSWIDSYLDLLLSDLKQKHTNLEHIGFGRFSELRRQIDAQREELKAKIDEIAHKFIEKTKEKEKAYNSKMEESLLSATKKNFFCKQVVLIFFLLFYTEFYVDS